MRTFFYDVKRLLVGGRSMIAMIAAPALLIVCFAVAIGPYFFSGDVSAFTVAVDNRDDDPTINMIIGNLVKSEQARALVSVEFADSPEDGERLLAEGAAALIIIEDGFQETLYSGGSSVITVKYNPDMPLEAELIDGILQSGANLINTAQGSVNAVYRTLSANGYGDAAMQTYSATSQQFFSDALSRSAVFDVQSEASPLGQYVPVEYYACALIAIFMILGALPVTALACGDQPHLPRWYLSGGGCVGFALSKTASGAAYLFINSLPAAALAMLALLFAGYEFDGLAFTAPTMLLATLMVSSLSVMLSALVRRSDSAVKLSFLTGCALIAAGGLIIPTAFFGSTLSAVASYTPAAVLLRSMGVMFSGADTPYLISLVVMAGYTVVFAAVASLLLRRRG